MYVNKKYTRCGIVLTSKNVEIEDAKNNYALHHWSYLFFEVNSVCLECWLDFE